MPTISVVIRACKLTCHDPARTANILVSIEWLMQSTKYVSDTYKETDTWRSTRVSVILYRAVAVMPLPWQSFSLQSFFISFDFFQFSILSGFSFSFSFFVENSFWVDNEGQRCWKPSAPSVCESYLPHMQISGRINGFLPECSRVFPH